MRYRLREDSKGFSLIEVILSMAILALISIPLLKYFTDSMKYNAITERQQKATILAQSLVEEIESVDVLIGQGLRVSPVDGSSYSCYSIPYMDDSSLFSLDTSKGNTLDRLDGDGTGDIFYKYTGNDHYDVDVHITTTLPANDTARPIIEGIDDTKDVIAVEREQMNEAITYFLAINTASHTANPSVALLTADDIRKTMARTIKIEVEKDATGNGYFYVRVYYDYVCLGLRGDLADGSKSSDTYTSTFLRSVSLGQLQSIYILYNSVLDSGKTIVMDAIEINYIGYTPVNLPEIYMISQDASAIETTSSYSYQMQFKNITSEKIHSNISGGHVSAWKKQADDSLVSYSLDRVTGDKKKVRLIDLTVEVRTKGTSEVLASYHTTKGD